MHLGLLALQMGKGVVKRNRACKLFNHCYGKSTLSISGEF